MKLKKNILKIIALSILLNNMCFYSNANSLSRYETLEGEMITLDNVESKDITEIEIFGNTVQDPNNLEDVQSIGDLYVDEEGEAILDKQGREQYKIEIESSNDFNMIDDCIIKNDYRFSGTNDDGSPVEQQWKGQVIATIPIFKDETYVVNRAVRVTHIYLYDTNDRYVETVYNPFGEQKFTSKFNGFAKIASWSNELDKIYFGLNLNYYMSSNLPSNNIEKYKTIILLPCQLMKIGNIADRLYWDSEKGRYIIEKNIMDITVSQSDISNINLNWYNGSDLSKTHGEILLNMPNSLGVGGAWITELGCLSSKYKAITKKQKENIQFEGVFLNDGYGSIGLMLSKSQLGTSPTVQQVKDYIFDNNNINIKFVTKYKEALMIETNINKKIKLPIYTDKTYIYAETENGIKPTLKVTIDRIEKISQKAVDMALSAPTSNNLTLARMFVNMLPDSLYKDQLQEQLNGLFSEDMVLDKKSASANIDLYIKSENILVMSLDTNSITFDDFSGVDDMEKTNAINITVNSSLPYNLNAYLPVEIQNSDKSKSMDLDIFSIRENSELEYQKFSDINHKLTLKSSCESSNNKQHRIDLKLNAGVAHEKDVYKTTIKFEAEQK